MVTIHIPDHLVEKLSQIASQEARTVDAVASDLLEKQLADLPSARPGSGAAFLKAALAADIHAGDLAGHSREILDGEFADDLQKRLNHPDENES